MKRKLKYIRSTEGRTRSPFGSGCRQLKLIDELDIIRNQKAQKLS